MEFYIKIKLQRAELDEYRMHELYASPMVLLISAIGCEAVLIGFMQLIQKESPWLFMAAIVVVLSPVLYARKKVQREAKELGLPKESTYVISDQGVRIEEIKDSYVPWKNIQKAFSTGKNIVLWMDKEHAYLFPRQEIKEKQYELIEMISKHIEPSKVKIRGAI